ncbi:MAG: DUF5596 domain-containing protein [Clostridia bacterium]|nr:DUF5596 domain-containing protein [Clostridia bacterium]
MVHYSDFVRNFMEKYEYPAEAIETFTRVLRRLDSEKEFGDKMDKLVEGYMYPEADNMQEYLNGVIELSKEYDENECTLDFIFLLLCTPIVYERYMERGLSEQLFWDTMADMKYKLIECIKCEEVPGTFVAGWYNGFFKLERFCYGRFQFEETDYGNDFDFVTKAGYRLTKGQPMIGFHIPSSGVPLTDEVRLDAYKKAYEAYKHLFPDGIMFFSCGSWLLYPRHKEFLPEKSNILRFMSDFEIISWSESEDFHDAWRIFDKYSDLPADQLPTDTSLRKAYAEWLKAGNKGGGGNGVIVFDGEKILR